MFLSNVKSSAKYRSLSAYAMIFAAAARLCSVALISIAFTFENVAALVSVWFRRLSIAADRRAIAQIKMEAMHTMHKVSRMKKLTDTNAVTICCLMVYFLRFTVKQHRRCFGRRLASPPRPLRRMLCCMASSSYFVSRRMNVSKCVEWVRIERAYSCAPSPVRPACLYPLLPIIIINNNNKTNNDDGC